MRQVIRLFTVVTCVALLLVGCAGRSPEARLDNVRKLMQEGDRLGARLEAKNLIIKYPESEEAILAHYILANLYDTDGQPDEALSELGHILSRKSQKDIEHALHRLEQKLGRSPLESEIAAEMELSLAEYQSLLSKVRGTQLVYLEDMTHGGDDEDGFLDRHVADAGADPAELLRDQRLRASLVNAIKSLPEREQYIMGMYYEHDMNLKEIAAVLGVTESRVCQLHSQSIARLRAKMRSH